MKLLIAIGLVGTIAGCASRQPEPAGPETVANQGTPIVVRGGQVCREEKHVRSRIPKVRCTGPGPRSQPSVSSMSCTGAFEICGVLTSPALQDDGY